MLFSGCWEAESPVGRRLSLESDGRGGGGHYVNVER